MRNIYHITLFLSITILTSFVSLDKFTSESSQLQKFELYALKKNMPGKIYTYDLTKKKGCNKTIIKYLGIIKTKSGKQYKVLNSFFVFTAGSTCHGTSNIKIYDKKNNYVGRYPVEMPYELPEKIIKSKIAIWTNSERCDAREGFTINFEKGLPKTFFLPCSKNGGKEYSFSSE
jgi:hypothetical protein